MDKQDLATEIYYELDFIRFVAQLCDFAIKNDAKFEPHHYEVFFWYLENRSWEIEKLVEKLENFESLLPTSQENIPTPSP